MGHREIQALRVPLARKDRWARLVPKALRGNRASQECQTFPDPSAPKVRPDLRVIPALRVLLVLLVLQVRMV